MRLLKTLLLVAIVAAFAVPVASAETPKQPKQLYYSQKVIKPGEQYKAIVVGRNISVLHAVVCGKVSDVVIPNTEDIGAKAQTFRFTARATTRPCRITIQVIARSLKHNGFCVQESVNYKTPPMCQIPAAKPRA